jgi:hypothetical protein
MVIELVLIAYINACDLSEPAQGAGLKAQGKEKDD